MLSFFQLFRLATGVWNRSMSKADLVHLKALNGLFAMIFGTMLGTTLLAAFAANVTGAFSGIARFLILILWIVVFVVSSSALTKPSTVAGIGLGGAVVGVPAEGDSFAFAQQLLKLYAKVGGLWLLWSGLYALILCAFPWLVGTWASATLVSFSLLVLGVVVSYALATGMMKEGPWHVPVIWTVVTILVIGVAMGVPKEWYASTGPEASVRASELVKKSAAKADQLQAACIDRLAATGEIYTSEQIKSLCRSKLDPSNADGSDVQFKLMDLSTWVPWAKAHPVGAAIAFLVHIVGFWLIRKWRNGDNDDDATTTVAGKKVVVAETTSGISFVFLTELGIVIAIILGVYSWAYGEPVWLKKIQDQISSSTKGVEAPVPAMNFLTSAQAGNLYAYVVAPKDHPYAVENTRLSLEVGMGILDRLRNPADTRTVTWNEEVLRIKAPDGEYRLKQTVCAPPKEYDDGRMYSKCTGTWSKGNRAGPYELTYNSLRRIAVLESDAGPIEMEFR